MKWTLTILSNAGLTRCRRNIRKHYKQKHTVTVIVIILVNRIVDEQECLWCCHYDTKTVASSK